MIIWSPATLLFNPNLYYHSTQAKDRTGYTYNATSLILPAGALQNSLEKWIIRLSLLFFPASSWIPCKSCKISKSRLVIFKFTVAYCKRIYLVSYFRDFPKLSLKWKWNFCGNIFLLFERCRRDAVWTKIANNSVPRCEVIFWNDVLKRGVIEVNAVLPGSLYSTDAATTVVVYMWNAVAS